MAKLVILCTLLWIGEDLIGFGNFLELLLCLLLTRVAIRMKLERESTVGLLYVVVTGAAIDAQQIVVVFFFAQAMTSILESPSPRPVGGAGAFSGKIENSSRRVPETSYP